MKRFFVVLAFVAALAGATYAGKAPPAPVADEMPSVLPEWKPSGQRDNGPEIVGRQVWPRQTRATIAGPETVSPGQLVSLKAESDASFHIWIVFPRDTIKRTVDNGRELVFSSGCEPGAVYEIELVAVWSDEAGPERVEQQSFTVTVEGEPEPGPLPPPDPVPPTPVPPTPPGPTPAPDLPDGQYGFSKLAYQLALEVPSVPRGKASLLAANFEAVASAMAAGGYQSLESGLKDLTSRNQTTLGSDREAWLPWFLEFQSEQGKLYDAGTLKSLSDFAEAYREIGLGLRAIR